MLARGCVLRRHSLSARRVLGLQDGQSYTPADIKKAFRERALTTHPDAGGHADSFRQLQDAYEVLLHEYRVGKKDSETATASEDSRSSSGFYAHPHAQWSNDMRSHRAYWHGMHNEMNMNASSCGSYRDASSTHYRAHPHHHAYGEGLGEEFQTHFKSSFGGHGQRGSQTNFSTWYFYRPYESDYRSPYGTGFTPEEIHQATQEQRRAFAWAVMRHTCLWSGLAFVVYLHERNNRVWRATEARGKDYQDPEYWAQVRKEEEEAQQKKWTSLRLEHHWLDAPLVRPLMMDHTKDDHNGGGENVQGSKENLSGATRVGTAMATHQARMTEKQRRQAGGPTRGILRGVGGNVGGPRVVSYQGRPFTPNGVRGKRNTAPKTPKTYADDVTYEMADEDDDVSTDTPPMGSGEGRRYK
ncbi:conserved hypothetical protein [Leishmania braziliensis MHOM/BR/75/M2904]|uniref:J domain-containing protein n=2 Tax=Leishmania braziliensis TaxID=5660 RepID=A4HHI9_LEIBR|nr:conserved hypothetical protein [Leishmania braziliensis MHOM/BR/75/M2904]CAJ2476654.1 unnamed protein product [Leishmania braziliensis]CAM40042.1 conserved hypothetical protein [Leishmania braziliensis MHOM/BR/75/M2904]SYZ67720.1 DnaJ_domain_containing_protein [Leishmania braziliensis MHOM/BR/75/M2904]